MSNVYLYIYTVYIYTVPVYIYRYCKALLVFFDIQVFRFYTLNPIHILGIIQIMIIPTKPGNQGKHEKARKARKLHTELVYIPIYRPGIPIYIYTRIYIYTINKL